MNKIDILKTLAPGFLPLIIFILADSIWGTNIGLIVAVVSGIIEFIISYFKEKTIDKFILLDLGLIVILGMVSIALKNDIFFKLKPALIELIFCIILGISVFSPVNIMMLMARRYMKGIQFDEAQARQLNRSLRVLFYIFLAHTILIVYSAFFMSKGAWAFISGGLFYILFAVYFIFELIRARRKRVDIGDMFEKYKDDEWFDIVDPEGRVIGKAPRSLCHSGPGLLHPVVHVHIIDERDRIFLQKRAMTKQIQPGKWDTAVGGHVSQGETVTDGLKREAAEELGITEFKTRFVARYIWESQVESELVYMFVSRYDKSIMTNNEEIDEGAFWKIKKIKESLGKDIFTPNFEFEFKILLENYFKQAE